MHILGVLSEHYSSEVSHRADELLKIYMNSLKEQSTKADPDQAFLARVFKGLTAFLSAIGGSVEEESGHIKPLFLYVIKAIEMVEATRYDTLKGIYSYYFVLN